MDETLKAPLDPEKEAIVNMPIREWVAKLKVEHSPSHRQKRLINTIQSFIRTKPTSPSQVRLMQGGKLYPWLVKHCGLMEIRTIGDLATVFQKAPTRNITDEPWRHMFRSIGPTYQRRIEIAEAALIHVGAL